MIEIDTKSRMPIYEQIVEGITKHILYGAIKPGEQLPSVRVFATQLAVNPNTVQKAYQYLEDQGAIFSVPGKGSFAALEAKLSDEMSQNIQKRLQSLIGESARMGFPSSEIQKIISLVYEKEEGNK